MEQKNHYMEYAIIDKEVKIFFGDLLMAAASHYMEIREFGARAYDPMVYIPKDAVDFSLLVSTDLKTACPIKGNARYWNPLAMEAGPDLKYDTIWEYHERVEGAECLEGMVAFAPSVFKIQIGA